MTPERPPRTAAAERRDNRSNRNRTRADGFVERLLGGKKDDKRKPPKKKVARISVEKFTSRMYSHLGRMVAPLSRPMSNCLQAQAAMAGVILEDTVQGTFMDRLIQPAARAEDKLDKAFALAAPPILCLLIEQSAQLPQQQMVMRQALLMPMLREALTISLEVTESYADQIKARIESNAKRDAEVDDLIKFIFGQAEAEVVEEPEMAGAAA